MRVPRRALDVVVSTTHVSAQAQPTGIALRDADELSASVARALTGEAGIYPSAHRLFIGEAGIQTGATHHESRTDGPQARASADAAAAHLLGGTLRDHPPPNADATLAMAHLVYGVLCQFRDEYTAALRWPGVQKNLFEAYEHWVMQFKASLITETQTGLLLFTVIGSARSLINGQAIADEDTDVMETMRASLVGPQWGGYFQVMRRQRHDAAAYTEAAWLVALGVAQWLEAEAQTLPPNARRFSKRAAALLAALLRPIEKPFTDLLQIDSGDGKDIKAQRTGYRIFTDRFDIERTGEELVRAALLPGYRRQIDDWLLDSPVNIGALAERVRRQWAVPVRNGWELETESGYLSAERLSLLVTSPQERNVFKQERYQPEMSAAVSILLDCSGSMRNQLPRVLPMVEVLTRVFERAGVQTEVLGYTTASWNGGKAQKAWERAGRPDQPGRLAERLHMVLKSASQTRRAAGLSIAALLKPDLYREGLDGEAVQWAAGRLMALPVTQRLVMVVSDGSPMETATQRNNAEYYLDHHLRTVLRQIERAGSVAVMGLGVGLDLSVYYRHCLGWTDTHIVQTQSIANILKVGFEAQRALRKRR